MKAPANYQNFKSLDYTGIFFSLLCLAHCLFLPVLMSLAPTLTNQLENEWVHFSLLAVLVPVALVSLLGGWKSHKKISPLVVGGFGVTLLLGAVVIEHLGVESWESRLTLLGSTLLITAHVLNLKHEISVSS